MKYITAGLCLFVTIVVIAATVLNHQDKAYAPQREYTVGVVLKAMDSEHWLAVRAAMIKVAQEERIRLIVLAPGNEYAWDEQEHMIQDVLNSGIDALIVSSDNINRTDSYMVLARSKNIPVFSIDEKIAGTPYIGSDNYEIGRMAAAHFARILPSGAEVATISGSSLQDAHIQRVRGFNEYIRDHTDLKLAASVTDNTKYIRTAVYTEQLLQAQPQIRGLFVTSAVMTLGAIDVTDKRQGQISVIGVDTQNDALMALKDGKISAMISQDGGETGRMAMEAVAAYLKRRQMPQDNTYITNKLITPDDADEYLVREDF
jgi:ribose transport system substrate-binding protein